MKRKAKHNNSCFHEVRPGDDLGGIKVRATYFVRSNKGVDILAVLGRDRDGKWVGKVHLPPYVPQKLKTVKVPQKLGKATNYLLKKCFTYGK